MPYATKTQPNKFSQNIHDILFRKNIASFFQNQQRYLESPDQLVFSIYLFLQAVQRQDSRKIDNQNCISCT